MKKTKSKHYSKTKKGAKNLFKKDTTHDTTAMPSVVGQLQCTQRDFGFVLVPNGDDVFVSSNNFNGAFHGDVVKVHVRDTHRGLEGSVVSIVQKNEKSIVGTVTVLSGNVVVVIPDDTRYGKQFLIKANHRLGAIDNDKVVVELVESKDKSHTFAKIVEVLGQASDVGVDVLSIIREYGLQDSFSKKVSLEASAIATQISKEDTKDRIDFRQQLVVTIDGDDTKDIDDAISVKKTDTGYTLGVHIADVSHYVKPNSEIDKEAFKRGTSVYFANSVIPMLPKQLSNGICSLNPNVDRLTLSLTMDIDFCGNVVDSKIVKGLVNTRQLTYTLATQILDSTAPSQFDIFRPMLNDCVELSSILTKKRKARGSIDFDLEEAKIDLANDGSPISIQKKAREKSHILIEEFMLVANETVAKKFAKLKIPFVYRVHVSPDQKKLDNLLNFIKVFGIKLNGDLDNLKPKNIQEMLESARGTKIFDVLSTITLRAQMKATYEATNLGHFGLATEFYCHFTSPIRRYPDLMIHRIISQYLLDPKKKDSFKSMVHSVAKQSSSRERTAVEVERRVENLKKAQFMQDKIGQEYKGKISGIVSNAIFVELDNTVEGRIDVNFLPRDNYVYDSATVSLKGSKHRYALCDEIKIKVESVVNDKIYFCLSSTVPH